MKREFWFRTEYGVDGTRLTCTLAEPRETDNGLVFFVRARDIAHAWKIADRKAHAARMRARRAQYAREGKCRCGRPWKPKKGEPKRCPTCTASKSDEDARYRERLKGVDIPRPSHAVTIAARRDLEREIGRLEGLREALRWFLALPRADACARITGEIEKLAGKAVA